MYEPCFPIYHIFAENEGRVQAVGGSLKTAFARAKMATNPASLPLHPGAARYYKEAGLLK